MTPQQAAEAMREKANLREANESRQREWDPSDAITLAYRGNELAGEVGEACNILKKLERERLGLRGSRASIFELAEELADVVICVDLIAMQAGINLEEAIRHKFNATSAKYGLATRLVPAIPLPEPTADPRDEALEKARKAVRDVLVEFDRTSRPSFPVQLRLRDALAAIDAVRKGGA